MSSPTHNRAAEIFNRDVETRGGYIYALDDKLSGRLASERWVQLILGLIELKGRSVIDIGCGDAASTVRLWDRGEPRMMSALDPAVNAVFAANARARGRQIRFVVANGHHLPYPDDAFDVAILEGILHHDSNPETIIREAFRVARDIVVLEPNGYNPILKLIERLSKYHREHEEMSYPGARLRRWVESADGRVVKGRFGNLVPVFCPEWLARILKFIEPTIENVPVVNRLLCAVYVFHASRA